MSLLKMLIPCFFCFSFTAVGNAQPQQEERIVEKIEVTNVELPVWVFFKGKPFNGLKKADFTLYVNGKKRDIHGFYEFKKKLAAHGTPPLQEVETPSRLFLLIFNICDYNLDTANILDIFFKEIFRADDRLMVITNRFFFDDREISHPAKEKERLEKVLQLEMENTREKLNALKQRMKTLLRSFKARLKYSRFIELTRDDFIRNYRQLVREFKNLYLTVDDTDYLQLAQYLKEQKVEKWVLIFYQVGRFFKPKLNSEFRELLLGNKFLKAGQRYHELQEVLQVEETLLDDDLSKVFADTGATFHTLLMEDRASIQNDLAHDLSYKPIISGSYNLLKKIAKKTGGTFMNSDKIEEFYGKITTGSDICYILTYVPGKGEKGKKNKLKVTVKNKEYVVYYDDGKRGAYFRDMMKKKPIEIPQIRIDHVAFNGRFLTFVVSDFKLDERESTAKLPVRLQVFNRRSERLYDGVETFTIKDLKTNKVKLQVVFPKVPAGLYEVLVWVGDPLTGKNDLTIKELNILHAGKTQNTR